MLAEIFKIYTKYGVLFNNDEISSAVLPIHICKYVIDIFSKTNILILGGDIFVFNEQDILIPTYDNWSYEGVDVKQSAEKAKSFLLYFEGKDFYIDFVVDMVKLREHHT